MDFLNDRIKPIYLKYLAAAFGSAMITSVYSIVDMAMVGQYHGPEGTAAVIGAVALAVLAWIAIWSCERPILTFFGADESLLVLAQRYMRPIKWVFPLFLFNQMLAAFLRNDRNPVLATLGVLLGGAFNVFGDYFFVFVCDMGIHGAGLATALGSAIYGPIINVSTFVQCCAYSVGQAAQPIISTNYGAGKGGRIRQTLRLALWTSAFFGVFWTALSLACPNLYIRIFMSPTEEILAMAPAIVRTYAVSFLLLLPVVVSADALWLAMPVTELLVICYAAWKIRMYTDALPEEKNV